MDLTRYEGLLVSKSVKEAFTQSTIEHYNNNFSISPNNKKAKLNNVDCEVLYTSKNTKVCKVLFMPNHIVKVGDYLEVDGLNYILNELNANPILPKAKGLICNGSLKWLDELGGVHEYMANMDGIGVDLEYGKVIMSTNDNTLLTVTVQYNDYTKLIKPQQRFVIDSNAYEIDSIDRLSNVVNGVGTIEFKLKFTSVAPNDDTTNNVSNPDDNNTWGSW